MAYTEDITSIKTGDTLLFSSNTPTGFLLRTCGSTKWNHAGIAVRLFPDGKISLTEEGKLYVLETNTMSRYDPIVKHNIEGVGYTDWNWLKIKYNEIITRPLRRIFLTNELALLTEQFMNKYRGKKFPSDSLPFISLWLGVDLSNKNKDDEFFCSQLMARYYLYVIGPQYSKITGFMEVDFNMLFGTKAPHSDSLFTPEHYISSESSILNRHHKKIFISHADLLYVLLPPLLCVIFMVSIIYPTLN